MGRPKKYLDAQEASAAKRASNNRTFAQRQQQELRFVMHHPVPDDIPIATATATGIRSDLDIPFVPADILPVDVPGVLIEEGRAVRVLPLPPPLPLPPLEITDSIVQNALDIKAQRLEGAHEIDQEVEPNILQYIQELELAESKGQGKRRENTQDSLSSMLNDNPISTATPTPTAISLHISSRTTQAVITEHKREENGRENIKYVMSRALPTVSSVTTTPMTAFETICSVGVDPQLAKHALIESQGNMESAFEWIFSQPDTQAPFSAATATDNTVDPIPLPLLVSPSRLVQSLDFLR